MLKAISSRNEETGKEFGASHYFKHIRDKKSVLLCIGLLFPFVNICVKCSSNSEDNDAEYEDKIKKFKNGMKQDKAELRSLQQNFRNILKVYETEKKKFPSTVPLGQLTKDTRTIEQISTDTMNQIDQSAKNCVEKDAANKAIAKEKFLKEMDQLRKNNDQTIRIFKENCPNFENLPGDNIIRKAAEQMERSLRKTEETRLALARTAGMII